MSYPNDQGKEGGAIPVWQAQPPAAVAAALAYSSLPGTVTSLNVSYLASAAKARQALQISNPGATAKLFVNFTNTASDAGQSLTPTAFSGTGTVATVTVSGGHNITVGQTVLGKISGATPAGYNTTGLVEMTAASSTTLTYASAGTGALSVAGTLALPMDSFEIAPGTTWQAPIGFITGEAVYITADTNSSPYVLKEA